MKQYEIYWSDLTEEAQERLQELYHENIDSSPLAIIDLEEDVENDITPKQVWETLSQLGLPNHYLGTKSIDFWDEYDHSNYKSLRYKAGKK